MSKARRGFAAAAGAVFADVVQRPTFAEDEVVRSRTQAVNALRVNLRIDEGHQALALVGFEAEIDDQGKQCHAAQKDRQQVALG
jgi:hypothetical protein